MFCLGLGMILCTMFVFFRDIGHFYGVIMLIWMYLTPIFYPVSLLEEITPILLWCNPLYCYISMFRCLIMKGQLPSLEQWLFGLLIAMITFLFGIYFFRKYKKKFILYI